MDISNRLSEFAAGLRYEDIPPHVIEVEKRSILDNIAIISGGAGGDGCRQCLEFAEEASAGGKGEAAVLGAGKKLPAIWAAFVNASMVMALDFSDTSAPATIHPNTSTFAVALAIAEKLGGISGKDFITAMVAGSEVAVRIALGGRSSEFASKGFYLPPVLTSFGATAAAARLLGLDAEGIKDAWSLNMGQYACSAELTKNKETPLRSIRESFGAKSAYSSAFLAMKGIKGFKDPFEGEQGFYFAFLRGEYFPDAVLKGLGEHFYAEDLVFKPWPCCMGNHGCINAALNIMRDHHIDPADITALHAEVPTTAQVVLEPVEMKLRPQNAIHAKYSLPFTVSTAILDGKVTLSSFTPDRLTRPDVLALAAKFTYSFNDDWDRDPEMKTGGRLTITTKDGRTYSDLVSKTLGNPENPMTEEAFQDKFHSCMDLAPCPASRAQQDAILNMVGSIEDVKDIRELANML